MVPFLQRQSRAALDPAAVSSLLTGIVAYWKCDEASGNLLDSVGSNHLTTSNVGSTTGKIGNCRFLVSNNGVVGGLTAVMATNFGAPSLATWYFIAARHDAAANVISISVNDGTPNTAPHSGGAYDGTEKFGIGNTALPNGYFDGQIDEVGLWKRYLTDAEITTLYNGGTGKTHPFS